MTLLTKVLAILLIISVATVGVVSFLYVSRGHKINKLNVEITDLKGAVADRDAFIKQLEIKAAAERKISKEEEEIINDIRQSKEYNSSGSSVIIDTINKLR